MDRPLDQTDWRIIGELQRDGRLSYNQLGRRVNLSPPAAAERVRRLEESGVTAGELPEVTEVHKLSGNWCSMLKVRAASMRHLEGLFERLGEHGEMNSHIVLSTQFEGRPVEPPAADARPVTEST